MPKFLLHDGASVQCAHGGKVTPTVTVMRVKVSGQAIATLPSPWQVAGCALPPPTSGNGPCVTATFTTAATRVTSLGQPVLLFDSQATCAPPSTPTTSVASQTRVTAQ